MGTIGYNYYEKVYSGLLGKVIGVRLGAPVEPTLWTYEKIKSTYGNITSYLKKYKNFAADDDINGPLYLIRALIDYEYSGKLKAVDVGKTWLNYTRENKGMFWWDKYGTSTEHTAYLNLKSGLIPPKTGSSEVNGLALSEQIGGQIFIDSWGLVLPSNPLKAAEYAEVASSVSHDKNGLYGARFMAACISKAFDTEEVFEIVYAGLSTIPYDSEYSRVIRGVIDYYINNDTDFHGCRQYLKENWGYDKYPGICHIIPNAGVCILALLYGEGDLSKTVEIATMCGWDTDCNAGNVGTIMGVANGLKGVKEHYRKPINDIVIGSSISGYLNIIDLPTFSKKLTSIGYKLAEDTWDDMILDEENIHFDFNMPGSTHGFRSSNNNFFPILHTQRDFKTGNGALEVLLDRPYRGKKGKIFYKPYYRRRDFDDERYSPTFAPVIYPGQDIRLSLYLECNNQSDIRVHPYVRDTITKEDFIIEHREIRCNEWDSIEFKIPDLDGHLVDEVGIIIESFNRKADRCIGRLLIDEFEVDGKGKYSIDFKNESIEFGCVTPFSHNRGSWTLEDGLMNCICLDRAEAYTGNYFAKDIRIIAYITPRYGESHKLSFRVKGAMMGYHIGFDGKNSVSIIKNNHGLERLKTIDYPWQFNREYKFEIKAVGNLFSFYINGIKVLKYEDNENYFENGMFGFSKFEMGRTSFGNLYIEEL